MFSPPPPYSHVSDPIRVSLPSAQGGLDQRIAMLDSCMTAPAVTTQYSNTAQLRVSVLDVLAHTPSLVPSIAEYVSHAGDVSSLLCLNGTVPIFYHGVQYNIPMVIWIPEVFPDAPPICYVTPVQGMKVKPRHKCVDFEGLVSFSYLSQWHAQRSDLVECITIMSSMFSEDPPLFQVSESQSSSSSQTISNNMSSTVANLSTSAASNAALGSSSAAAGSDPARSRAASSQGVSAAAMRKDELTRQVSERLLFKLRLYRADAIARLDMLSATKAQLIDSSSHIEHSLAALTTRRDSLGDDLAVLSVHEIQCNDWLSQHESKSVASSEIDSIVVPSDALSRQMHDLVATDLAIDDALYVLDRALQDEKIDHTVFLKHVRKLARDQFNARALASKVLARQKELLRPQVPSH